MTAISVVGAVGLSIYSQVKIVEEQTAQGPAPAAAAQAPAASAVTGATSGGSQSGGATSGASVYSTNCSGCHGAQGQGQPGAFPPLAKNPTVTGDPAKVIHIVSYGLSEKITVAGSTYNGQMPPWKGQLTNAQIAGVISYIRSSFGNSAAAVTEADVAKVQK